MKYLDLSKFKHPVIIERKDAKKDKRLLERIIELELTLDSINKINISSKEVNIQLRNTVEVLRKEAKLINAELINAQTLIQSQRIEIHSYKNRKWFDIFK